MNRAPTIAAIGLLIARSDDALQFADFIQETGHTVHLLTQSNLLEDTPVCSVIITDKSAARRNGSALMALQQRCATAHVPILIALDRDDVAAPWLRCGFDDVLRFPLDKEDLLARLEVALRRHTRFAELVGEKKTPVRPSSSDVAVSVLADEDRLTGLPNRALFRDHLKDALSQARFSNRLVAVMLIDLDKFKMVNDTLGHDAGDALLQQAGCRLVDCLRDSDTVGRLGGDEFGVFLPGLGSEQDATVVAEKISASLSQPFWIEGTDAFITPSIGIAMYPADSTEAETLIAHADTAMVRAKELGRNNHQFFTPHLNAMVVERARIETGLRKALERGELYLDYQPQTDIRSGRIIGVEALMRWRHPELGLVSPARFIPVAEELGLIVPFGEWAMRTACEQNMAWQTAGLDPIVMAVNLSARQFRHDAIGETVRRVLEQTGLDGRYLELEVTESMVMGNGEALISTMKQIKGFGVRLSLDDFGTGYSNLGYLNRFPLDSIKIDKSFIDNIGKSRSEDMIATTVISLGHSLRLKVIAEGVETAEQLGVLESLGCDMMQGFLFSRPVPPGAIRTLLEQHQQK